MPRVLEPEFKKTADFKGDDVTYNGLVWESARVIRAHCGNTEPDSDMLRVVPSGVSKDHVTKAIEYLQNAP